jgi:hypothetical protein
MAINNGYIELNLLKSSLQIEDNSLDDFLELAIEGASRQIDAACERVFYQSDAETRVFTPRDSYVVEVDDLRSVTSIKSSSDADGSFDITWAAKDYQLEPLNGRAGGIDFPATQIRAVDEYLWPIDGLEATVQIEGDWGWDSVPTQIKQACLILSARLFERRNSPLGIAGFSDVGAVRVSRFDADIENLIMPFKKVRMA